MTGWLALIFLLAGPPARDRQKVDPASATLADFNRRVDDYVKAPA